VLLVDDDPAAHDLLAASLKGTGYRLVHANNGAAALNLARTIRPDAITLDVIMPTTDGWEVLSALKADADLCDIPVVIVTIAPDRGIGLSLGAVDVLTKPVDRMPEMSGFEVLRRLKAAEHTSHIPVIVISALDELDSAVGCIEAGAEDYLTKPFNPILLRARIGASLEKSGCAIAKRHSLPISNGKRRARRLCSSTFCR
jgi:DNA-binding response OmpR family regulator